MLSAPAGAVLEIKTVAMPNSQRRQILIISCSRTLPLPRAGGGPTARGLIGAGIGPGKFRAGSPALQLLGFRAGALVLRGAADRHHLDRMADLAEDAGDQFAILLQKSGSLTPLGLDMNLETPIRSSAHPDLHLPKLNRLQLDVQNAERAGIDLHQLR